LDVHIHSVARAAGRRGRRRHGDHRYTKYRSNSGTDAVRRDRHAHDHVDTGDQVTVRTSANGTPTFLTRSGSGFASFSDSTGDHYVVPAIALPYLGKQLDLSLFDVSALDRDGVTGKLPVRLSFGAGVTPTAPAGVTFTSVSGGIAEGYVASGSAFAAALRQRLGADIAAGHRAGSGGLADGVTGISLAAAGAPAVVRPFFPLHILQINATDLTGQPADLPVILINTDSIRRQFSFVPVIGGIGKVAVPAGNYAAFGFFADFDAQGNFAALRLVTEDDFAVADTPTASTVTVDERTATTTISGTTPVRRSRTSAWPPSCGSTRPVPCR